MSAAVRSVPARRARRARLARWRSRWGRLGWLLIAAPGVLTVVLAGFGTWWAPHRVEAIVGPPYQPASAALLLGTDHLGHDVVSGLLSGARGLVIVPVLAVLVGSLIGVPLGLAAGWRASGATRLILAASELLLVLPPLLIVLLALNADSSTIAAILVVGALGAVTSIRYLRTATARAATSGYLEHAVALGERPISILFRELVPALLGPILTDAGVRLVGAVYLVASLSFLGLSPLGGTNWASMLAANTDAGGLNTAALLAPGVAIVAFAVSVNLLADRLAGRLRGQT